MCCQCEGLESQFGPETARRELRRFRRRGPNRSTQRLIDGLRAGGVDGASLLDIGGGVGAIHHTLLDAGARDALHVDVSPDYIEAARDEAGRRGHADRVLFLRGDFVQLSPDVTDADVVTLDRVICCYPDMPALVGNAADKTRRLLGAVYPRDRLWIRLGVRAINALMRVRRSAFRVFVHSPAAIEDVLRSHGLARVDRGHTLAWEIAIFARHGEERPR
jgi:magnesium-protoporphyrin O-methyltransferase